MILPQRTTTTTNNNNSKQVTRIIINCARIIHHHDYIIIFIILALASLASSELSSGVGCDNFGNPKQKQQFASHGINSARDGQKFLSNCLVQIADAKTMPSTKLDTHENTLLSPSIDQTNNQIITQTKETATRIPSQQNHSNIKQQQQQQLGLGK